MNSRIRALTPADAAEYQEIRLRALREHPEAFATSEKEERARPLLETATRLRAGPEQATLGAYLDERLVGIATLVRPLKARLRHRATLTSMYVVPEARASGVGSALLDRAVERAAEWGATDLALAVTVGNAGARRLYLRAGFVTFGVEPRSLLVDGVFYDVEWMNLQISGVG